MCYARLSHYVSAECKDNLARFHVNVSGLVTELFLFSGLVVMLVLVYQHVTLVGTVLAYYLSTGGWTGNSGGGVRYGVWP